MAKDFHLCLEQSYSQKILMPDWFSLLWVTRALGDGLVCYHQALTLWNILGHQVHDSKTAPRFIKYNLMHVMHQQQDLIQNLERHFVVLNSRMSDLEDKLEHMELGLKMLRKSCLTSEHQDQMRFILIPLTTVSSTCFSTSFFGRWPLGEPWRIPQVASRFLHHPMGLGTICMQRRSKPLAYPKRLAGQGR